MAHKEVCSVLVYLSATVMKSAKNSSVGEKEGVEELWPDDGV